MPQAIKSILFVCLGNICRSPLAEGVMRHKVRLQGLEQRLLLDSCGTGAWHVGNKPDRRSIKVAASHGIAIDDLRARKVNPQDFHRFDLILAMDRSNLSDLEAMRPANAQAELGLYLEFCQLSPELGFDEVPDPYFGGPDGFQTVFEMIDRASDSLINQSQTGPSHPI